MGFEKEGGGGGGGVRGGGLGRRMKFRLASTVNLSMCSLTLECCSFRSIHCAVRIYGNMNSK